MLLIMIIVLLLRLVLLRLLLLLLLLPSLWTTQPLNPLAFFEIWPKSNRPKWNWPVDMVTWPKSKMAKVERALTVVVTSV